jgi:CDP-diglyceride synthetase
MSPTEINTLHILHVASAMFLVGWTFYAFAGPPESRKRVLVLSGIVSLVVLLTGIREWQGIYGFHGGWPFVKLACWLGLSAIAGIAYRRRERVQILVWITVALVTLAVVMAYTKPF